MVKMITSKHNQIIGLFSALAGCLLIYSALADYYPIKIFAVFFFGCILISFFAPFFPLHAIGLIIISGLAFGNQPGAPFTEYYILYHLLWLVATGPMILGLLRKEIYLFHKHTVYVCFVYFVLIVCATAGSLILWGAILGHYHISLFTLLSAPDYSPVYPFTQVFTTGIFILNAFIAVILEGFSRKAKNKQIFRLKSSVYLAVFFLVLAVTGIIEINSESFRSLLDRIHIRITGFIDTSAPHLIIPFTKEYLPALSPNSLYWNRSWFAVALISTLPFVYIVLSLLLKGKSKLLKFTAHLIIIILLFYLFLAIGARGAFAGFMIFSVTYLLLQSTGIQRFLQNHLLRSAGIILIITLYIIAPLISYSIDPDSRGQHILNSFKIFSEFPLFGAGFESYGFFNRNYLLNLDMATREMTAHNQILQVLTGTGLAGTIVFLLIVGFTLNQLLSVIASGTLTTLEKKNYIALFAGLLSILVYQGVQEWWYIRPVAFHWWLMVAVSARMYSNKNIPSRKRNNAHKMLKKSAAILLLVFILIVPGYTFLYTLEPEIPVNTGIENLGNKTYLVYGNHAVFYQRREPEDSHDSGSYILKISEVKNPYAKPESIKITDIDTFRYQNSMFNKIKIKCKLKYHQAIANTDPKIRCGKLILPD